MSTKQTSSTLTFTSIEELNKHLSIFAQRARHAISKGDFIEAQHHIEQVLSIVPRHAVALTDLGFVKNRQNKFGEAYHHLLDAIKYSGENVEPNIYDTLIVSCVNLNRIEEALYYAKLSIKLKKALITNSRLNFSIPNSGALGISSDSKKNIISYSLFGGSPRYCEVAVLNVKLAKQIYPEWTCRFYIDHSVPRLIVDRLVAEGAEIVYVNEEWRKISGLFWRFAVISDPNVQCFIIRDADSLLSYKEKAAVNEWINSKKYFHIMRDGLVQGELILAGMWGGYTGIIPNIMNEIISWLESAGKETNIIDQLFLRNEIYPIVSQNVLIHDSYHLEENAQPYPDYEISEIEKIPHFHIGMVDTGASSISLHIEHKEAKRVRWWLFDEENNEICSYESDVDSSHKVQINLPYFYSCKIKEGKYHFSNQTIE